MTWFLIALVAPFLWAIVNIADQYLIANFSQREKERSSGGLVIFSSIIGIIIALLILIFTNGIFDIPLLDKSILLFAGLLTVVWIILYLYTLEIEEVSNVIPWFLMVPVFGYILGYIFLGETLTNSQMIGSLIILCGLVLISINFKEGKRYFKKKLTLYMVFASMIIAISGILFKYVTIENNFWVSSFWEYLGLGIAGLLIFLFIPKHRNEFLYMHRTGGRKIFFVNVISELMSITGNLMTNFALLLAPVTLVYLVGSLQPALVLILSILGTKFLPHIIKENISTKILIPKIIAIALMTLGSVFLFI